MELYNIKNVKNISGGIEERDFERPTFYVCDIGGQKCDEFAFTFKFLQEYPTKHGQRICALAEDCEVASKFVEETFGNTDFKKSTSCGFAYQYENGDTVEWVSPLAHISGKRYNKVFIHKVIAENTSEDYLALCARMRGVKYFD